MRKIKHLNDEIISKIAAGEIISRPLNIVKELVENSIDASARQITISIDKGKISVEDNGTGIEKQCIELAFMRHCTSKISRGSDLDSISTLGFRGEALYAISVISCVDLYTKTDADITGSHFGIKGAKALFKKDITKNTGTKIVISDLFFNLPARKKHLKDFNYEARLIASFIEQISIINCDISFTLKVNQKIKLYTSGNTSLKQTIFEVYKKQICSKLTKFSYEQSPLYCEGYVSDLSAKSGGVAVISVNKRLVSSKTIHSAVKRAYEELTGSNGAGDYILKIDLPYNMVDVNVHPSKEEVRFANETLIFLLIKNALKEVLSSTKINPVLNEINFEQKAQKADQDNVQEKFEYIYETYPEVSYEPEGDNADYEIRDVQYAANSAAVYEYHEIIPAFADNEISGRESLKIEKGELKDLTGAKTAGNIFNRYIIIESQNSIYLLDQHAAHERIIYEQLLYDFSANKASKQLMLIPYRKSLAASDILLIKDNIDILYQLGFEISFDQGGIAIHSVPVIASKTQSPDMLFKIIEHIKNVPAETIKDRNEDIIAMSCRLAVKSGRALYDIETDVLIANLIKTSSPFICPHGRDIIVKFKKTFIDSLFGR